MMMFEGGKPGSGKWSGPPPTQTGRQTRGAPDRGGHRYGGGGYGSSGQELPPMNSQASQEPFSYMTGATGASQGGPMTQGPYSGQMMGSSDFSQHAGVGGWGAPMSQHANNYAYQPASQNQSYAPSGPYSGFSQADPVAFSQDQFVDDTLRSQMDGMMLSQDPTTTSGYGKGGRQAPPTTSSSSAHSQGYGNYYHPASQQY